MIRLAADNGAAIVVTTETFLDGYAAVDPSISDDELTQLAETVPDGACCRRLAHLSRELKIYLLAGLTEKHGTGLYNTAVLFDPEGTFLGRYHKQNLVRHDAVRFRRGQESPVFTTACGTLGAFICSDRKQPQLVQRFCDNGADFLICLSGGHYGPRSNDAALQARSKENGRYIVFVHPCEFLVTDPSGGIASRIILDEFPEDNGEDDAELIRTMTVQPDEIGSERDTSRVCFFAVPRNGSRYRPRTDLSVTP